MKEIIRQVLPEFFLRKLFDYRSRKFWITRKSNNAYYLSLYWNDRQSRARIALVDIVVSSLKDVNTPTILEYGSHVGINLDLITQRYSDSNSFTFFAVEPNLEAFNFMMNKMPFIHGLNGDENAFIQDQSFPPKQVSIAIINTVLYAMPHIAAKSVLRKIAETSEEIVIGDALGNIDGITSIFNKNPAYYKHPYRTWLIESGFTKFSIITSPDPKPQNDGFLIARRS